MPVNGSGPSTRSGGASRSAVASSEDVVQSSSKNTDKAKAKSKKSSAPKVTPAKLEEERNTLLSEKQSELAAVVDRHDDLLREKFHLETYVMMVDYDPEVAKQDGSQVFQDFKSRHDLLDTVAPTSASPRKTRSSHAAILNGAGSSTSLPIAGPSTSISAPLLRPSPVKSPTKIVVKSKIIVPRKGKEKAVDVAESVAESKIIIPRKGKERAVDVEEPPPESISVALARGRSSQRVSVPPPTTRQLRKRPDVSPEPVEPPAPTATESETVTQPPRKRRKIDTSLSAVAQNPVVEVNPEATSISAPPVNGRVLRGKARPPERTEPPQPEPQDTTVEEKTTSAPLGRVMPHRTAAHRPQMPPPPTTPSTNCSHTTVADQTRETPGPPAASPNAFLGSWVGIGEQTFPVDHENGSNNAEVLQLAEREAMVWERVEAMKRAGQWFGSDLFDTFRSRAADPPGTSASGAGTPFDHGASAAVGATDPAALAPTNSGPDDAWAAVVRSVVAYGRRNRASSASGNLRNRKTRGALIAAQVASKIQGYWDGEAAKLEKGRVVEERRLRGLAKTIMKLVVGEWKKAVFHIREQERLRLEAEELKRGQTHLDAILDQSGHILETQQGDLSRGADAFNSRSRSSSVSANMMGWEGEEEDEEESSEDEGGDQEGDDGDEGERDEAGAVGREEEEEDEEDEAGDIGADITSQPDLDTKSEVDGQDEGDPSTSADLLGVYPSTPGSTTSALPDPSTPASDSQANGSLDPDVRGDDEEPDYDDMSAIAVEDMMNQEVFSSPIKPLPAQATADVEDSEPEDPASPDAKNGPTLDGALSHSPMLNDPPIDVSTAGVSVENTETEPASVVQDDSVMDHNASMDPSTDTKSKPDGTETQDLQKEGQDGDTEPEETEDEVRPPEPEIPAYLRPYAVAPVEWNPTKRVTPPPLLRGFLRPYQQSGLEWLASLHSNNLNGILADEMGLGKTIQTIALLAHLACDRGIWGPHLIIVPTSVLLNWEMEFKKFLPGFRILSYHGSTKRRKELRQGWNEKHHLNVCITSYTLASRDAVVFKRKPWYYMILDEAHMIKNFKSQRWNTLLMFRSFRRLLLTGTPLQNNLTELWALLQFLMSGSDFVNLKEFGDWFSNPLEKAIEAGNAMDEDTMQRVTKLHTVLRPYLLRRLKRDVEKELPSKYEHLVLCPLSKRQRFLYDEFMSRAHTRDALQSGIYQKIANILMQLRKVCNHPDLFEVRPIVTSFAMERSVVADFEIKELLLRRRLLNDHEETLDLDLLGLRFIDRQGSSLIAAQETRRLDGTTRLPFISEVPEAPPPKDTRTIAGWRVYSAYQQRAAAISRWAHIGYVNRLRCKYLPIYSSETLDIVQRFHQPLLPLSAVDPRSAHLDTVYLVNAAVKSYATRGAEMVAIVNRFAFVTPPVVALDLPRIALAGHEQTLSTSPPDFDTVLHHASVKLQIAFPDPSLLQYDCGKLQQLTRLLREKKAGGHRVLIFTQMTKILDILEIYLNFHGYLYLRLDGATKIEDRQYITERFNADPRVFCFIASSRSGGVGINLTGADTVVFYDSDFNPQMDRQCEDRAHRIGQIRDVHIYRFVSSHTVEEAMLRKANQKRSLDDLVIQKGEFDWRSLFADDGSGVLALEKALEEFDDTEDAHAAAVAAREEVVLQGQDQADFLDVEADGTANAPVKGATVGDEEQEPEPEPEEPEEGGSVADYMIAFVQRDADFFRDWKL
ncbi:Helicase SWR1 [Mycena sanguinolenta]|uniref:Helicase SWR1 n=1 Tax=Mycena sanguinolenta TaxID=230812 RepID=A0A8H6Y3A2_9AGAR|nr:Helicase SWR1 [Mycena sanguinolenta]